MGADLMPALSEARGIAQGCADPKAFAGAAGEKCADRWVAEKEIAYVELT